MRKTLYYSLLIAFSLQACTQSKTPPETALPELPVYTLKATSALTTVEYPATIGGTVDIEIRPQIGGILESISVDEGDYVTKGQLLFTIDDRPYRVQHQRSTANLNAAQAALALAELEIEKLEPLVRNNVVSDFQLKSARTARQVAHSNVEQAKAVVEEAKIHLRYTQIHAPINGYIGHLPKRQGSLLSPTDIQPLTTLSHVREVYVYFSLSEVDFIRFKNQNSGHSLEEKMADLPPVTLQLADKTIYEESGKIEVVNGQFDQYTGAIMLRATFPNPKGVLRWGNTGKIQLKTQYNDVLLVPQEATVEIQDKVFVFYVDSLNQVFKRPISISSSSGNHYLVRDALKSGDQIVLKGFENLQDGTTIRPKTASSELAETDSKI